MCGALTTRSPSAVNMAQLKSSRSLTFTLLAVLRSVMPICSAMPANWLLKTSRHHRDRPPVGLSIARAASIASVSSNSPRPSTSPCQPGSMTVVDVGSQTMAGPLDASPGRSCRRRKTAVALAAVAEPRLDPMVRPRLPRADMAMRVPLRVRRRRSPRPARRQSPATAVMHIAVQLLVLPRELGRVGPVRKVRRSSAPRRCLDNAGPTTGGFRSARRQCLRPALPSAGRRPSARKAATSSATAASRIRHCRRRPRRAA